MLRTSFDFSLKVSGFLAAMVGPLHATSMAPSAEGSVGGLLIAGAVLVGIGRFRRGKR
jgi:hypothetical protein